MNIMFGIPIYHDRFCSRTWEKRIFLWHADSKVVDTTYSWRLYMIATTIHTYKIRKFDLWVQSEATVPLQTYHLVTCKTSRLRQIYITKLRWNITSIRHKLNIRIKTLILNFIYFSTITHGNKYEKGLLCWEENW